MFCALAVAKSICMCSLNEKIGASLCPQQGRLSLTLHTLCYKVVIKPEMLPNCCYSEYLSITIWLKGQYQHNVHIMSVGKLFKFNINSKTNTAQQYIFQDLLKNNTLLLHIKRNANFHYKEDLHILYSFLCHVCSAALVGLSHIVS